MVVLVVLSASFCLPSPVLPEKTLEIVKIRELINTRDNGVLSPAALSPFGANGILLTDTAGRSLYCFDREGFLKWKTDGTETGEPGFLSPGAIASSRGLSIFVLDRGLRKVLRFDVRGAFSGYLMNESLSDPACLAQGNGGELYIYDSLSWELTCVEPDGSLRWKVNPWKLKGRVSSIRIARGEIHMLVRESGTIYSYGKFGEYVRDIHLKAPGGRGTIDPTSFWLDREGFLYVCTQEGSLLVYDTLLNPIMDLDTIHGRKLEGPCDMFVSGKTLYLLDCGNGIVYEISLK